MKVISKVTKKGILAVLMLMILFAIPTTVYAAGNGEAEVAAQAEEENDSVGDKAMAAAIAVGLAAAGGAIGMGMSIAKSVDGISRQPEAEGKIRTTLMLGLVFVETAIIYALVVAILIIFVM
ncbi:MAG: ATP synthase F0 subunit C [Lachnospiraceae bacterium]|nr:ATP synthase F0 subunit C [Lachnospiraceae bacterium]